MTTVLAVSTNRERRTERLDAEYYASPLQGVVSQMAGTALEWITLPSAAMSLRSGGTPPGHRLDVGEVPFITIECIEPLWLDMSRTGRVLRIHREKLLRRVWLREGDVLITIKRRIANAAVVYAEAQDSVVNQDVAVLRPNGRIPPEVIVACLSSRVGQSQARLRQTEQINPYLSVTSLRKLTLPLLPEGVQNRVIELVRQRVELQRSAEECIVNAMAEVSRAARIRQGAAHSSAIASISSLRLLRRLDSEFYCRAQLSLEEDVNTHPLGSPKISSYLSSGVTPAAAEYSLTGPPIFKVGGLSRFSIADWLGDRVDTRSHAAQSLKGRLEVGDVLVLAAAHDTRYIGKAAVLHQIPSEEQPHAVGELIIIRPTDINGPTLTTYLNIPAVRRAVQRLVRGQSAHLYPVDLQHLPVPEFSSRLQARVAEWFDLCQDARNRSNEVWRLAIEAIEMAVG